MTNEVDYAILQLSDLHVFDNTEWNVMQKAYSRLPHKENIKCVVVTGDLHQYKSNYEKTIQFLNHLLDYFKLTKKDIFIIPGNHDSEKCENKDAFTSYIETNVDSNPDCYREYFVKGKLNDCFSSYDNFIETFYSDSGLSYKDPEQVHVIPWSNKINFIHLNTAINCNGNNELDQIVDVYGLSNFYSTLNQRIPSIILAHHSIDKIHQSHRNLLTRYITDWNISAYLCGDSHKVQYTPIMTYDDSGKNIPCIVCGKSAPETGDNYSDLGCILYVKEKESNELIVQPFDWDKNHKRFVPSNKFYSDSGNLHFKLLTSNDNNDNDIKMSNFLSTSESIWLPDAEKATGTQARFESFTETNIINKFTNDPSPFWGLSAVKGIGKTFVLQVKRRKIPKTKLCLPMGIKPSADNGWGTDSIVLSNTSDLNPLKKYSNARLLWEYCIILYAINQLLNIEISIEPSDVWWDVCEPVSKLNEKIEKFYKEGKIDKETYCICKEEEYSSLDKIINYVLNIKEWTHFADKSLPSLYLIEKSIQITLKNLKKEKIVIFIDKVDQAVRQTSSEPPHADCSTCWKREKILKCQDNNIEYCNNENTPCRIECCYGCEKYETPHSNTSLRVYEDSTVYRHVNVWQYIQIGLLHAISDLKTKFGGVIEVYFTIREEAYSCEVNLWGDKSQKIAKLVEELWYTKEQQRHIYNDCIRNQQDFLLFNSNLISKADRLEEAFVGVSSLCHPFARDLSESVFDSIYRHSFDRSRDIQEYGEYLTLHMAEIRQCKTTLERGEMVKKLIEDKAAELAFYYGDQKSIANKSYYVEKIDILPNFWANPNNFKRLITMMSRNLMFSSEVRHICKKFNGLKKCKNDCDTCKTDHYPFSMLYKLGMLGQIKTFPEWKDNFDIKFLHSKNITYITGQNIENISDGVIYLLHPALTKSIEHLNKKILHFNGFIIGKDLSVSRTKLKQLIEDHQKLNNDDYTKKYFYEKE